MTERATFRPFAWPPAAAFARVLPKVHLDRLAKLAPGVRQSLTDDVRRVTWTHKLDAATTGIRAGASISEIQVIELMLKARKVPLELIDALDSAIPHPVIFEVTASDAASDATSMVAATKSVSAAGVISHSSHHQSDWVVLGAPRRPLPVAPTLDGLHDLLLEPLLAGSRRAAESIGDAERRLQQVASLDRVIAALERRLRTEPQLNRKLELRRELRRKHEERELLE